MRMLSFNIDAIEFIPEHIAVEFSVNDLTELDRMNMYFMWEAQWYEEKIMEFEMMNQYLFE